ncbi:DUF1444 family protein [Flavobacterium sp. MC2016-06]|jgi:uncharacterized protein YtpQ (UPF0354 family)|uniref:DUF1444 family protein n=1 Tax=Flavobacterium sp. MC2016-06 TaxID=2676308 RepID=UPI0012BADA79|nr:DUF1444 family protein [Flavobacterium sp. MC2016-06]MBU3862396.1 DUF1444 family protein [Flavobacterium sp. MC2016-06]
MGFLNKLFGKKKEVEATPKSLDTPMADIQKEQEGYVNFGQNIYPIIKNEDDPKIKLTLNTNPILTDKLADGIVVCYVLDMGENFIMLAESHLRDFGLTIDEIREVALRNLAVKVNENCQIGVMDFSENFEGSKPFYRIAMDGNFDPSIMLLDEFWENHPKDITESGIIAVSIPAKNILLFSDLKLMESFRTMRPIANQFYESSVSDGIALTKNTYIRKDGKWVLFLDTAEQMAEFYD